MLPFQSIKRGKRGNIVHNELDGDKGKKMSIRQYFKKSHLTLLNAFSRLSVTLPSFFLDFHIEWMISCKIMACQQYLYLVENCFARANNSIMERPKMIQKIFGNDFIDDVTKTKESYLKVVGGSNLEMRSMKVSYIVCSKWHDIKAFFTR